MMKYNASKVALTEIILAYHLTLFGHIAQMDINVDAKQIPISSLSVDLNRLSLSQVTSDYVDDNN